VLGLFHADPGTSLQLIQILAGETAVLGKAGNGKQHVAVVGNISVTFVQQFLHQLDDLAHVGGGARFDVRTLQVQSIEIGMHLGDQALGEGIAGFMVFGGALDDLIIHVGDVAHEGQVIAQIAKVTCHHVEGDEGAAVTDMTQVVDGDSTHVHAHLSGLQRFEFFFLACEGVVDLQHGITCVRKSESAILAAPDRYDERVMRCR